MYFIKNYKKLFLLSVKSELDGENKSPGDNSQEVTRTLGSNIKKLVEVVFDDGEINGADTSNLELLRKEVDRAIILSKKERGDLNTKLSQKKEKRVDNIYEIFGKITGARTLEELLKVKESLGEAVNDEDIRGNYEEWKAKLEEETFDKTKTLYENVSEENMKKLQEALVFEEEYVTGEFDLETSSVIAYYQINKGKPTGKRLDGDDLKDIGGKINKNWTEKNFYSDNSSK